MKTQSYCLRADYIILDDNNKEWYSVLYRDTISCAPQDLTGAIIKFVNETSLKANTKTAEIKKILEELEQDGDFPGQYKYVGNLHAMMKKIKIDPVTDSPLVKH